MTFAEDVRHFLSAHPDIGKVEVVFTDINGIARGMQFPVSVLDDLAGDGVSLPASSLLLDAKGAVYPDRLGGDFQGDPDVRFHGIANTLKPMPWTSVPSAQVLATASNTSGTPAYFDPRAVLAHVVERFTMDGLTPVVALESEFYLFEHGPDGPQPAEPSGAFPRLTGPQCLSIEALHDFEPFLRDVESLCERQNVPLTSVLAEYGDAQFEANLHHVADAVSACDQLILLKRIVKATARRSEMTASFMAKPVATRSGSGLHCHVSIVDSEGRNIFARPDGENRLRHAIGGVLEAMPESIALFCPNANSYRRFQPESYVPQGISWGPNHRLVAVRVPPSGDADRRLEHRVAGADASPYLFVAGILAGVHHGLEGALEPPPMTNEGEKLREAGRFPNRWPVALDAFASGHILPGYLGHEFHTLYLKVKRQEEARYNAAITSHDHDWYFRIV